MHIHAEDGLIARSIKTVRLNGEIIDQVYEVDTQQGWVKRYSNHFGQPDETIYGEVELEFYPAGRVIAVPEKKKESGISSCGILLSILFGYYCLPVILSWLGVQ